MRKTVQLLFVLLLVGMVHLCVSCLKQEKNQTDSAQITDISLEQGQSQTVDAISGKPINEDIFTYYQGVRIYFCCVKSKSNFESNPERYIQKLKEQDIIRERSPKEE